MYAVKIVRHTLVWVLVAGPLACGSVLADDAVLIGLSGANCSEDEHCINRLHHALPMTVRARPGQRIIFETRNTTDFNLDPENTIVDPRVHDTAGSTVHPLTGPVYIETAHAGDVLAITIEGIRPGKFGLTAILPSGFLADLFPIPRHQILWRLTDAWAESDALPGIRIPYAAFPGIITVLPDASGQDSILKRERVLHEAGGTVSLPEPVNAVPASLCGESGSAADKCLRTVPPREHGGNFDIRYLGVGVTVYLPCYIDGCGLAIGDVHYAQGDGEVSGTAIEMDASVTVTTRLLKDHSMNGISYEGPSSLLDVPSRRFYATTGIPVKAPGFVPPELQYLDSARVSGLENLSRDISLAARNALMQMLDYLVREKGLTREQAYILMSVAVDVRIGQLVDAPNVIVSAILPLDVFIDADTETGRGLK